MPRRRTGLVFACFAPQNRQNARKAAFLSAFCGFVCVFFCFHETLTHRPPELFKFPMPAVRHENKGNLAMPPPRPGRLLRYSDDTTRATGVAMRHVVVWGDMAERQPRTHVKLA